MSYTPGPWNYNELIPDGYIIKRKGTYEIATPKYDVCTSVFDGAPIRKEADARLIAAAPDLLEACKFTLSNIDYLQNLWGKEGITDSIADALRAAVAKAEDIL